MSKHTSETMNEPPEQDPRMGDKTPAFVEWMFKHKPEEAKKRYGGRKVMGIQLPLNLEKTPEFPKQPETTFGDIPESSMAEEKAEQWMKK